MFLKSDSKEVFEVLVKKSKNVEKDDELLKKRQKKIREAKYIYDQRQKAIHDEATRLEESYQRGYLLGRERAKYNGCEEMLRTMKKNGMTAEEISSLLSISIEVVEDILK